MNRYAGTQSFLLKKFLNQNKISRSLGARVTRYIEGVIELRHTQVHPSKVEYLTLLSGPLNLELNKEMRMPRLSLHPLFTQYCNINSSLLGQLCSSAVSSAYFAKNDVLFREGALGESMYFLGVGALAYRYYKQLDGMGVTTKVDSYSWFSEGTLWLPWIHRGQMKAISHADVTMVCANAFVEISGSSEDVYKFLRGCAFKFIAFLDVTRDTDLPNTFAASKRETEDVQAGAGAANIVSQAEDMELHLMQFDK
jgi:hypothetical protein